MAVTRHRTFALVLAGGGARGFAHAGVLRALEREGLCPGALVGVSMGALVGVTYSLRRDWYRTLVNMDTRNLPGPQLHLAGDPVQPRRKLARATDVARTFWALLRGWGEGEKVLGFGRALLEDLYGGQELEQGRIPVAVGATDLNSGQRVVLSSGSASSAVYASVALAGVLPPLRSGDRLLADGAYSDIAPIDIARGFECDSVIAVNPSQQGNSARIENGLQAMVRAVEICHTRHAGLRLAEADLVISPRFRRSIDTLDFSAKRECIAAGVRGVRGSRRDLAGLLGA